jgi:hypothetical protein
MTTMIADPPTSTTRLGVGLDATRRRPDAEAWKRAIGTKGIPARLALLPEGKPRWSHVGLSAICQISIILFVVLIPLLYPEKIRTALNMTPIELPTRITMVEVAPPPPKIKPKVTPPAPKPVVVEEVKLNPKQPHVFITPKVVQPTVQVVEAKALDLTPKFE